MNQLSLDFARAVYRARVLKGLSQEKTAELAGISTGWLQHIEKGEANPSLSICARLAAALDLDLNQFVPRGGAPGA